MWQERNTSKERRICGYLRSRKSDGSPASLNGEAVTCATRRSPHANRGDHRLENKSILQGSTRALSSLLRATDESMLRMWLRIWPVLALDVSRPTGCRRWAGTVFALFRFCYLPLLFQY